VVHFDPWWNPAAEAQATDRAHRIGQTRPVTVYRLLTRGTVEEKVVRLQAKKRELSSAIDEDGIGDAAGWSMEELESML
jgi:SNF2 family DNA or RNA helicase